MKPFGLKRLVALATGLALMACLGCSPLPSAPHVNNSATPLNASLGDGQPGADAVIRLPDDGDPAPDPGLADSVQVQVPGLIGARLTAGKVTVDLPPGAIDGLGLVKITVPDSTKRHCRLEILPGNLNHFDVPVKLTFDCSDWTQDEIRRAGVMWWDEHNGRWVQVDTDMDLTRGTVSANLQHFSEYKCDKPTPGKASW
jgi:hypothetical protein